MEFIPNENLIEFKRNTIIKMDELVELSESDS